MNALISAATAEEATRVSQVQMVCSHLSDELDRAAMLAGELESRLRGVLLPEPPQGNGVAKQDTPILCPLAEGLAGMLSSLRETNRRNADLLNRIEL